MRLFGAIEKFEKQDDGSLIVSGIASTEAVDADKETVSANAMRAALPEWMKFGNIREMHGKSAAGVAIAAEVDEDGKTRVRAKIVDSEAVKKIIAGVYKGFSIGGETLSRVGNIITRLRLSEISLVDRPANPECVLDVWKADKSPKPSFMDNKVLCKALALDEKSTDEQIAEAFAKRLTPPDLSAIEKRIEELAKTAPKPAPEVAALTAGLEKVCKTVELLQKSNTDSIAALEKAERSGLVAEAARNGKVIPLTDEEIAETPVKILKAMVAKLQKSVPTTPRAIQPVSDTDKAALKTGAFNRAASAMTAHLEKLMPAGSIN